MNYLKSLFTKVYIKDIVERKKIAHPDVLEQIIDLLCSSIGSLTNPTKIADTLRSKQTVGVAANTIRSYIGHLEDAFLFSESKRYDVKGKSYFVLQDSRTISVSRRYRKEVRIYYSKYLRRKLC